MMNAKRAGRRGDPDVTAPNGVGRLPATSLWTATATPAPDCPPLDGSERADVCVVGGGFTGLSAALHLAEGGAEVVLLEASEPGFGASGRNGGQVIPGLKLDPDEIEAQFGGDRGVRLVEQVGGAADLVFDLVRRHGIACDARQDGWIKAAHSPGALREVLRSAQQWSRRGAAVDELDRGRIAELTGTDGYVGGWVDHRGGVVQPLSYARGLARAAQRCGARVHGGTLVSFVRRQGTAWAVESPGGSVLAAQVILATNAYTDLASSLWPGLRETVIPVYSYIVATAPLPEALRRAILPKGHAVSDTRRLLRYFRLDPAGRMVMGGRGKFRESRDRADYRAVVRNAVELYPQLRDREWEFVWGGRVALTLDHMPHLHELAPGVHAGLGYNGRGVAMATLMGKWLALRAYGAGEGDVPFPATPPRPVPLHRWRRPILSAAVAWKRTMDRLEGLGGRARRRP
jgi:glycine/D-amino acid oxidase-like deaminating enzyme